MYCKECGTENNDDSLRCNKCNTYLKSTNSPLTGGDRTKIIAFFAFLILPFGWFGGSIVIILIAIFGLYIMKKDKSFTPILNARKYIKWYLAILFITITFIVGYIEYHSTYETTYNRQDTSSCVPGTITLSDKEDVHTTFGWVKSQQCVFKSDKQLNDDIQKAKEIAEKTARPIIYKTIFFSIITLLLVDFFIFIFDSLFFKPLEEHQDWIIKNGVFADKHNDKDNSTNIVGRDNLSSYSVADEMLKWHDLLEKGLVTKEEFEKAKAKLMNEEKI